MVELDGITVALVTPWQDGGIDDAALERIVRRACDAGVIGVCAAGTTGEGPRLTRAQRVDVVHRAAMTVPESVTIIGGVSSSSLTETLGEIEDQAAAGAHAVLVPPPSRMPLGADGCRTFFRELADRASIPVIIYHIPGLTGVHIPPEVVLDLADHEAIIGLKDSSADIQYHLRVADGLAETRARSFALLTGTDAMLVASMQAGGTGAILASANLVPAMSVRAHRMVRDGNITQALDVVRELRGIVAACRRGSLPAGWKAALELGALCSREAVPPGESLDSAQVDALRQDLVRLGVHQ